MEERKISKAVISRLPRYYRHLEDLIDEGIERISSGDLSKRMNVTASQIRQDLNNFGGFGQQGYGYNVKYLREEIGKILGLEDEHTMVIIGAGNLGQALAKYPYFEQIGFVVKGIFDVNPELEGTLVNKNPIRMLDELDGFLKSNKIEVAVLAIPKETVEQTAEILVENGIKAIWNFVHTDLHLHLPKGIVVENVHLSDSLMRLSYNITEHKEKLN
ncbi:MAG: redox-sensing transcriptional repressor Rex [Ruminococcus sp.]|nr:redox-sensing transcriptional repressor Rex [Ruminococcus sp.]